MLPLKAMVSRLSDESGVAGVAGEGEREPAAVAEEEDMMGGGGEHRVEKREHRALYLTAWECPPYLAAALTSELRPHSHPLFRDRFELLWQRQTLVGSMPQALNHARHCSISSSPREIPSTSTSVLATPGVSAHSHSARRVLVVLNETSCHSPLVFLSFKPYPSPNEARCRQAAVQG